MTSLDQRLQDAIEKRDQLASDAQRIAGKKEAAEKSLKDVEDEIRAKNLDPDNLDDTIKQLDSSFSEAVQKFETDVNSAEEALAPYLEN
jgi:predicted  nucleic acid-binding Zn-ribbon protein